MLLIERNSTVLFQGDSVTDCGRDRNNINSMGNGYPLFVSSIFKARYPELNVNFINTGISGDTSINLVNRWTADCIQLKPTVVSILIGINDCWRRYDGTKTTTVEEYKINFKTILERVSEELKAKIIIIEPFVLPFPTDRIKWREDLDPKIQAARELAREFEALYIPMDGIFAAASALKPPVFWANDGVHPTYEGHALIAETWLNAIKA